MIQYGMDGKDLLYVMSRLKGVEEKAPRVIKNALNHTAKKHGRTWRQARRLPIQ